MVYLLKMVIYHGKLLVITRSGEFSRGAARRCAARAAAAALLASCRGMAQNHRGFMFFWGGSMGDHQLDGLFHGKTD